MPGKIISEIRQEVYKLKFRCPYCNEEIEITQTIDIVTDPELRVIFSSWKDVNAHTMIDCLLCKERIHIVGNDILKASECPYIKKEWGNI